MGECSDRIDDGRKKFLCFDERVKYKKRKEFSQDICQRCAGMWQDGQFCY